MYQIQDLNKDFPFSIYFFAVSNLGKLVWQISAKKLSFLYKQFLLIISFLILNVIFIIIVLIRVAFITLLERKILGFVQIRKGPNKVGFIGLFQPFADAVKLFTKEFNFMIIFNYFIY